MFLEQEIIGLMDIMVMDKNYQMKFLRKYEENLRNVTLFNVFYYSNLLEEDQDLVWELIF
jgi:hypothetical protein